MPNEKEIRDLVDEIKGKLNAQHAAIQKLIFRVDDLERELAAVSRKQS